MMLSFMARTHGTLARLVCLLTSIAVQSRASTPRLVARMSSLMARKRTIKFMTMVPDLLARIPSLITTTTKVLAMSLQARK